MLYVGFVKRSMGFLIPTTSTIMNSTAKGIILTKLVNVKLLDWGMEFCSVRAVTIMLIHKTNGDSRGVYFWAIYNATVSRFY
jgi:hypothetical protein